MNHRLKATLRKNGTYMIDMRVKITFGLHDIVRAMINSQVTCGGDLPTSRRNAAKLAAEEPAPMDIPDSVLKEYGPACAERARKLFPDLCPRVDLTEYFGVDS